jgi:hypothetical protein
MGRWRPRMAPPRPGAVGATTARSSRAWSYPCLSRAPPGRQPPSPSRPVLVLVPVPEPDPASRPDSDADTASSSLVLPLISPSSLPQELVTLEQQPLLQGKDRGHAVGLPRHRHRRASLASAHPGRRNPSTGTLVCLPHRQTGSREPVNHWPGISACPSATWPTVTCSASRFGTCEKERGIFSCASTATEVERQAASRRGVRCLALAKGLEL